MPPSAADIRPILPPTAEEEEEKEKENSSEAVAEKEKSKELPQEVQQKEVPKPFQRLQFLVRDWQNFDTEYDPEETPELDDATYSKLKGEMSKYLNDVLRERGDKSDLQSTREQITRCFDTLDCYIFPHPGFAVTKKNYDGSIKKIEPFFRALMNRYVRYVFDKELQPKVINSRKITGMELKTYFEVYVKMFQVGETSFPKAMTMLDATAEANNRNAYDLAMNHFKAGMNDVAGVDKSFVPETQLRKRCNELKAECVQMFDGIATMGSESAIARMKTQLLEAIAADEERYLTTNSLRNPYKDIEFYIIPLGIAAVAWFLARVVDATCSTDFCEATEDTFVRVYMFIFFILTALMWKRIRGIYYYIKELIPLLIKTSSNADGPNAANIMEAMVEARNKVRNIQEQKLQQKLEREKKDKEEAEKKCKASAVAAAKDNIAKKSD